MEKTSGFQKNVFLCCLYQSIVIKNVEVNGTF